MSIFQFWYQIGTISIMAMTLRLTDELDAQLNELAQDLNLSKQQVAILALQELYERMGQRRIARQAFDMVLERDAELLKRLADS
jgi:predicted transcriptional regulator